MHSQGIENGMVIGAQDEVDDKGAHADREAKAFEMFCREFLDAVREGPDEPVSWYEQRVPLGYVLGELFEDAEQIAELVTVMKHDGDVSLHLASAYADQQVSFYSHLGGL